MFFYLRIGSLKCKLCSFVAELKESCYVHIQEDHSEWRKELGRVFKDIQSLLY